MRLQLFNGGKATRLAPHLIQVSEAVVYTNIDNGPGTLSPVKTKTDAGIAVSKYAVFYIDQAEWVSSATKRDYVEYQGILYWSDGVGIPQKYDGTNTYNLGIAPPATKATVAKTEGPNSLTRMDLTESTAAGNLPAGETLNYLIINHDLTTGLDGKGLSEAFVLTTELQQNRNGGYKRNLVAKIDISEVGTTHQVTIDNLDDTNFDDRARLYRLYDGEYRLLTTFTTAAGTYTDSVYDISANDVLVHNKANIDGTVQYVYTFYNSASGVESGPSPVSDELEVSYGKVTLSSLAVSSDAQVDKKRIYRIGGDLVSYELVATIDNATTSYEDNIDNLDLVGTVLESASFNQAPTGLKYLGEAYACLFGVLGSKLYFTEIGQPDAWPVENYLDFAEEITGWAQAANGLLIFSKYRTYIVTGTGPSTFAQQLLSGDQGCIEHQSIVEYQDTILWASTDGICQSSGNNVAVITKMQLGKVALQPENAVIHDEVYYLQETTGNIFALDFRYGGIVKDLSLGTTRLVVANDILYGHEGAGLHSMFTGVDSSFTYWSPELTEGVFTEHKIYKDIFVKSKGSVTVEVYIDGSSVGSYSYTTDDSHQLMLPQTTMRGFKLQFRISGTGTVEEIDFTVHGDGR